VFGQKSGALLLVCGVCTLSLGVQSYPALKFIMSPKQRLTEGQVTETEPGAAWSDKAPTVKKVTFADLLLCSRPLCAAHNHKPYKPRSQIGHDSATAFATT